MKIAITSVYANPLHPGHIECLELSKQLADELWVIVNNDHQAMLKRGVPSFQDEQFRLKVVDSLKMVDRAILSIDITPSVCDTLNKILKELRERDDIDEIIFTKGGDRFAYEIPEREILEEYGVQIVDGLGAKTHNSSSYVQNIANKADEADITKKIAEMPAEYREEEYIEVGARPWGVYYVLENKPQFKVKKIIVNPGARLSLQSHEHRSEHWVVVSGIANVEIREKNDPAHIGHRMIRKNESCFVPKDHLHRLSNTHTDPLVIIEVQSGKYTGEDDIKRYEDDYNRS